MSDGNLRYLFRKNLPDVFFTPIETGGTGRGVPDAHFIFKGVSGWIEYKATKTNRVVIRPEQVAWLERYSRNGGRCFIVVRKKRLSSTRLDNCDELYLYGGEQASILFEKGIGAWDQSLTGGPVKWNWEWVKEMLTTK